MHVAESTAKRESIGLAHVAAVSFLAARAAPSIGFWVALCGGAALARASARDGLRWGYGASLASLLQTIAIMGPARIAVPLTQALSAPLLGTMERRKMSTIYQVLACGTIRALHNTIGTLFFIFILSGGLDAYTGTYDVIAGRIPFLPEGTEAALIATAISIVAWTVFASIVQVYSYRRALHRWQQPPLSDAKPEGVERSNVRRTFDPRAVALASVIAFGLLIASTAWALLAAVAGFLVVASLTSRGDTTVARAGFALAAALGVLVFFFTLVGGVELEQAAQRGTRAALLVLVATWLRAAAGTQGLREVSRRTLGRLQRLPSVPQAATVLSSLDSGRQMRKTAESALMAIADAPKKPVPLLDSTLSWAEDEAARFVPWPPQPPLALRTRLRDALLIVLALAPLAALILY